MPTFSLQRLLIVGLCLGLLSACAREPTTDCPMPPGAPDVQIPSLQPRGEGQSGRVAWLVPESWIGPGLDRVLSAFAQDNPWVTVETVPAADGQMLATAEAMLEVGDRVPDVVTLRGVDTAYLAGAGVLDTLWNLFTFDQKQDWLANAWAAGWYSQDAYSAPLVTGTRILFLNLDLLGYAGLKPPEIEDRWTWNEVAQAAQKLTRDANEDGQTDVWGLGWETPSPLEIAALGEAYAGRGYGEKGALGRGSVDSSAWVKAFNFYGDLEAEGYLAPPETSGDMALAFARGELAMFIGDPSWVRRFDAAGENAVPFRLGATRFPVFRTRAVAVPRDGWHLALAARGGEKAAAAALITWMTTGKGAELFWTNVGVGMPAQKSLLAKAKASGASAIGQVLAMAAEDASLESPAIPSSPAFPGVEWVLGEAFARIREGEAVAPTLRRTADCIDALVPGEN